MVVKTPPPQQDISSSHLKLSNQEAGLSALLRDTGMDYWILKMVRNIMEDPSAHLTFYNARGLL